MSAPTDSSSLADISTWYETHPIPQQYNAGVIVASIAVSWLGSYSTLLLLGRRTANRGLRNIILLLCAATTMACVAIWGMHYVGMFMRLRPIPSLSIYVSYSAGYTVLSLLVPIAALAIVFLFLGIQEFKLWRILVCGVSAGLVVALMHFAAFFSCSFETSYAPVQTVFSIIIGCVAATVAFLIFFRWHSQWQDIWWKRVICALVLAIAVAAMHYCAMSGTTFYIRPGHSEVFANAGRTDAVRLTSAIAAMCFVLCLLAGGLAIYDTVTARNRKKSSRQIVVASAAFTKTGQLLVRNDGSLPVRVIQTQAETKDLIEELDMRQPLLQWLYTLSWDWSIIDAFLPRIMARALGIETLDDEKSSRAPLSSSRAARRQELSNFREQYLEAVVQLAADLQVPVAKIGVLFDKIVLTGTRDAPVKSAVKEGKKATLDDDEASIATLSPVSTGEEGIMLVLVREVQDSGDANSADWYRARGYRFTEVQHVAGVLTAWASMQRNEMDILLEQIKTYARRGIRPAVQPGGVYAALFGISPSTSRHGGIDQLVYSFARHQAPAYRLPDVVNLNPRVRAYISGLAGCTMSQVQSACEQGALTTGDDEADLEGLIAFQTALLLAVESLVKTMRVWPSLPALAQLSADIVEVPSSMDRCSEPAKLIVFSVVMPEPLSPDQRADLQLDLPNRHTPTTKELQQPSSSPFLFTPYSLFGKSQMMLLSEPGARIFANEVRAELLKRFPKPAPGEHMVGERATIAAPAYDGHALAGTTPLPSVTSSPIVQSAHAPIFDPRPNTASTYETKIGYGDPLSVVTSAHIRQPSYGSSYRSDQPGTRNSLPSVFAPTVSPRIDEDDDEKDEEDIIAIRTLDPPAPTLSPDFWKATPSPASISPRPSTAPNGSRLPESPSRRVRLSAAALAGRSLNASRPMTAGEATEMSTLGGQPRSLAESTWHGAALQALATGPQRSQLLGVDL